MPAQLNFELVSPEKLLFSKPVALVTVPGGEGYYGVLPGHAPLITSLRAGVIDVYEQNTATISERIFVAGGFAEVNAERCTVLAEEAMPVGELNRPQLEELMHNLKEDLGLAKNDADRASCAARLAIAQAKVKAANAA